MKKMLFWATLPVLAFLVIVFAILGEVANLGSWGLGRFEEWCFDRPSFEETLRRAGVEREDSR